MNHGRNHYLKVARTLFSGFGTKAFYIQGLVGFGHRIFVFEGCWPCKAVEVWGLGFRVSGFRGLGV